MQNDASFKDRLKQIGAGRPSELEKHYANKLAITTKHDPDIPQLEDFSFERYGVHGIVVFTLFVLSVIGLPGAGKQDAQVSEAAVSVQE